MPIPEELPEHLNDAFGQIITFNAIGPAGEPLRVAAPARTAAISSRKA